MFAREGAKFFAIDIDELALSSIPDVTTCRLDVTNREAIQRVVADIGAIDVLFNCAGSVPSGTILQSSEEELDYVFNLNVRSMYYLIRAFLPSMLAQRGGSIINTSSVASSLKGVPNRFTYSLTKAAVIGLTKSVAADFVGQGIRCNAICPGTVQTPSLDERIRKQAAASGRKEEEVRSEFVGRQPMGRLGEANEIAYLATYLRSWGWAKANPQEARALMKKFYAQGGVDISDRAMDQEFAQRPVFLLDQQLKILDRAKGASEVDRWLADIGAFMADVGTLPQAPDVKAFVTDDYMKMVAADPKLKAFATEFDKAAK